MRNWVVNSLFGNDAHRTIGHVDVASTYFRISVQSENNVNVQKIYMINERQYVHGGTASAVHLARKFGIPTFNMALHGPKALKEFLGKFGIKYKALPRLEDICL